MPNHSLVRVGPLTNIPKMLSSLGCKPEPIIEAAGFTLAEFKDPENKLPFLAAAKLLAQCVAITGDKSFGFLLGQHAEPSHLGIAGFLLQSAADVKTALNSLIKFLTLHDQGGRVTISIKENTAFFEYTITEPDAEAVAQIYDLSIVLACKIMRALCGEQWNPDTVQLVRQETEDLTPYQLYFQAPIHFNSNRGLITFHKSWLDHPIPSANPLLQQHLLKEAEKLLAEQSEHFVALLQKLLQQCLTSRQCVTATQLATQLGVHERTLNRHLTLHGTSFRQELEQIRYAISRQLLTETNESLTNIAISLGYSHSGAFSRAFKQWSGESPSGWRKKFFQHE